MKKSLISFVETFVAGALLAVLIMLFVGQSLQITGDSMYPTLKNGERIIVEKVSYKSRQPARGEIIVFRSLQNDRIFLIKRVIAVAGDQVGVLDGVLTINGKQYFDRRYSTQFEGLEALGRLKNYTDQPITQGYLAVMGDNRDESYDSRMFGLVPLEKVVGRAFIAYWPPRSVRSLGDN